MSKDQFKSWFSDKLVNAVIMAIVGLAVMQFRIARNEKDIEKLENKHEAVLVRLTVMQSGWEGDMKQVVSDISDIKGYLRGTTWHSELGMLNQPDSTY